jgi:phage portal protein BeeE
MRASLRPPPPFARSPAIRPAQHLSAASATVGANSATDVRVSAETAMQHTMVIARVTVISEPLGKLPNWLVRWLGNGGSVVAVTGRAKPASWEE